MPSNNALKLQPQDKPRRVVTAVRLLWASLAISTALSAWEILFSPTPDSSPTEDIVWLIGLTLLIGVVPIHFISKGANWARVFVLVLAVVGLVAICYFRQTETAGYWIGFDILVAGLDLVALYWLFTQPGSQWFRRKEA